MQALDRTDIMMIIATGKCGKMGDVAYLSEGLCHRSGREDVDKQPKILGGSTVKAAQGQGEAVQPIIPHQSPAATPLPRMVSVTGTEADMPKALQPQVVHKVCNTWILVCCYND